MALLIVICLFSTIAGEIWNYKNKSAHWYLGLTRLTDDKTASRYSKFFLLFDKYFEIYLDSVPNHFGYTFLTFFILFNNLIPISLQITVDLVKFIQAYFINWVREEREGEILEYFLWFI